MDSGTKAQLYIELLNKYIYFAEKGLTGVTEVRHMCLKKIGPVHS